MVLFSVLAGMPMLDGQVVVGLIVVAYGSISFAVVCRDPGRVHLKTFCMRT